MTAQFPAKSSYLGNDLPEDQLRAPVSAPGPAAPPGQAPVGAPPSEASGAGSWADVLAQTATRAGLQIDPARLELGPGDDPEGFKAMVEQLQGVVATDSEVEALDAMLDHHGMLGEQMGVDGAPASAVGGKPGGLTAEPTFSPSSPTGNMERPY